MSERDDSGAGVVLLLLTLIFVMLKLTGVIAWSWWAVFIPLWILPAFALACVAMVIAIVLMVLLAVAAVLAILAVADRWER